MLEGLITVIGTGLLGVVGWAFTLHSRVAVLESEKATLRELINTKLEIINMRLGRIENKLDKEQ